ncbi:MAG: glycosyltransferase [Chloroflexi bacterium]|nr:glycosyltransferase [Chloroflexota bacterium]
MRRDFSESTVSPPQSYHGAAARSGSGSVRRVPRQSGDFRSAHSIAPDVPLIGIVGRLVPIKNRELFLQAAVKVREAPAQCLLRHHRRRRTARRTGKRPPRGSGDRLRQVCGLGARVAPVYSDLDALVISSRNEGTPVSVIEGTPARCPVVTTAVGGLPDLLDQGALRHSRADRRCQRAGGCHRPDGRRAAGYDARPAVDARPLRH